MNEEEIRHETVVTGKLNKEKKPWNNDKQVNEENKAWNNYKKKGIWRGKKHKTVVKKVNEREKHDTVVKEKVNSKRQKRWKYKTIHILTFYVYN